MDYCADQKSIVFKAGGVGLGNRLRALIGYHAMSQLLKVPFYLCWIPDEECDASFSDLFESTVVTLEFHELAELARSRHVTVFGEPTPEFPDRAPWFHEIFRRHMASFTPWPEFMHSVVSSLRNVTPTDHILETVNEFSLFHDLSNAVGFHIRHMDNVTTHYRRWSEQFSDFHPGSISLIQGFVDAINDAVTKSPVLLVTDNKEIEASLVQRYDKRIFVFQKQYISSPVGRTSSIQEALIEMMLLGRCKKVVGTYYSSFSKFSAMWGRTEFAEIRGLKCVPNDFVDQTVEIIRKIALLD